jgi:hypothetical protein
MAATSEDIKSWFRRGLHKGATHMLVVCDTYDYTDYPSFVMPGEDAREKYNHYQFGGNMQKVMEVYDLSKSEADQMSSKRAFNF